jgi:UPF0755 protein
MTNDPWENEDAWDTPPVLPTVPTRPMPPQTAVAAPPAPSVPDARPLTQESERRSTPRPAVQGKAKRGRRDEDVEDYDDFPAPPRRFRGFLVFLVIVASLAGGALYGVNWVKKQIDPPGPRGTALTVTIPLNTPQNKVNELLHSKGIIGSPLVFRLYLQWEGKGGFLAGQYRLYENDDFDSVIATLQKGPSVPNLQKVTFPENFRLTQFAERVGARLPGKTAERFMQVANNGSIRSSVLPKESENLEGFLFPDTYSFSLDETENQIVSRLVDSFDVVAGQVGLSDSKNKVGLSPYQTLIVASLVEKEAKLDVDRGKIARVIYNRLKNDTALQIDASLIYGMGEKVNRVLFEDLKKDGPYNTYTRKGLPPTPISSVSRKSLEAALDPTPGDWLYYVVIDSAGTSAFAKTFKEHKANIKLAEKNGAR